MIKEITASGSSILEAKENARAALGVGELDEVQFEIIDGGTKGILGLFSRPAKVKAFIELPDPVERRQKKDSKPDGQKAEHRPEDRARLRERTDPKRFAPSLRSPPSPQSRRARLFPKRSLRWSAVR